MLLHNAFDFHAGSRGETIFASCGGVNLTYAGAQVATDRLATLIGKKVRQGGRLALLMRNRVEALLAILAASRTGAVVVPLNYRLAPVEWRWILADAEADLVIADAEFTTALDDVLQDSPIQRLSATDPVEGWQTLADAGRDIVAVADACRTAPGDTLLQIYTSGTLGRPKGVLISNRAIMANIQQCSLAYPHHLSPGERTLIALPLFHVAALAGALSAICNGAHLVIHPEVDTQRIVRSLIHDDISTLTLVPSVLKVVLENLAAADVASLPNLKFLGYGASPISEPLLRKVLEMFDCKVGQGYGLTELAGGCCLLSEADHRLALDGRPELLASAGRPLPGCELLIIGPDGEPLPAGETGEIVVRGEQLMSGYWKLPEATAEALRDGWMHTGDAGFIDDAGYVFIRDRIKDMIVTGAENVYPAEVEAVLIQHPDILEASVIGVPDDRWGEAPLAVIVLRDGANLSAAEVESFCRGKLGGYKIPRRCEVVSSLPRSAAGKVLRRKLRAPYWEGLGRDVN
ncbi:MAG: AMP-binding protein [Sphingomonadaceae bacterium]